MKGYMIRWPFFFSMEEKYSKEREEGDEGREAGGEGEGSRGKGGKRGLGTPCPPPPVSQCLFQGTPTAKLNFTIIMV